VESYRQFFRRCHELLAPGGWLALQTIGKGAVPLRPERMMDVFFIASRIFPESDLPRLAEIAHATEKLFEIVSVRNDREDYARTCREWRERLAARRGEAVAVVGEEAVDLYERYLAISIEQFDNCHAVLLRIAMRKVAI
jgi:cyclopropane-fatty-acyl-phospholipid synthase